MDDLLINLGLLPSPTCSDIKYQYFSRQDNVWKDCNGWDNGLNDCKSYMKYGYEIRIVKKL